MSPAPRWSELLAACSAFEGDLGHWSNSVPDPHMGLAVTGVVKVTSRPLSSAREGEILQQTPPWVLDPFTSFCLGMFLTVLREQ